MLEGNLVFKAHSPVYIMVVSPSGREAGFLANGTIVNQLGANMTGPDAEPEVVSFPNPVSGWYTVRVFGKPTTGTGGSAFTITADSTSLNGTIVGSWSFSGTATPASDITSLWIWRPGARYRICKPRAFQARRRSGSLLCSRLWLGGASSCSSCRGQPPSSRG